MLVFGRFEIKSLQLQRMKKPQNRYHSKVKKSSFACGGHAFMPLDFSIPTMDILIQMWWPYRQLATEELVFSGWNGVFYRPPSSEE